MCSGVDERRDIAAYLFDTGGSVTFLCRLEGDDVAERGLCPLICEVTTASLRTKPYRNLSVLGAMAPATQRRAGADFASVWRSAGVCVDWEGRNGRRQRVENEVVNLLSGRG